MSFLFPAMLLGLLGLSVPVALHLIARHRFPIQSFPSIRLLRTERRYNVFSWRLVDPLQLFLRLLILALLCLAMARFFTSCGVSRPAPRNLVVVVDASASMRTEGKNAKGGRAPLIDVARERAASLLGELAPHSRCALIVAGDENRVLAPLQPESSPALAALASIKAGDGTGPGLLRAVADACDMVRGRREVRSQIVVLTDLRASAFTTRQQDDLRRIGQARRDLGSALDLVFVDLAGGVGENIGIVEAVTRGGDVRVGDDVHILARVVNSGSAEKSTTLRLAVGGRFLATTRSLLLSPAAEAVVDLTAPMNRAQRTFGEIQLQDSDAYPLDDLRLVPVNVADSCRVLLVRPSDKGVSSSASALGRLGGGADAGVSHEEDGAARIDGATFLRLVLNPGRELGLAYSTWIESTLCTPEAMGLQPLSKYDVIVLYGVSDLPANALTDLDAFVRSGKSLLFFCPAECNPVRFNRALASASGERGALSPALIGNVRTFKTPLGLEPAAGQHPLLAPFRDRLQGDLSVLRFSQARELETLPPESSVLFQAEDGTPLAVERRVGQGRAVLLAFGLELEAGNVARTRAFPVLMWRLMDYLTGRLNVRSPDSLLAACPAVLDVSATAFAFESELEIVPVPLRRQGEPPASAVAGAQPTPVLVPLARLAPLVISTNRTVLLPALASGSYQIRKPQRGQADVVGYARPLTVNPDPRESRTELMALPGLRDLFGSDVRIARPGQPLKLSLAGIEFWTLLIALLMLAYVLEALIGFRANAQRQKERSEGGA